MVPPLLAAYGFYPFSEVCLASMLTISSVKQSLVWTSLSERGVPLPSLQGSMYFKGLTCQYELFLGGFCLLEVRGQRRQLCQADLQQAVTQFFIPLRAGHTSTDLTAMLPCVEATRTPQKQPVLGPWPNFSVKGVREQGIGQARVNWHGVWEVNRDCIYIHHNCSICSEFESLVYSYLKPRESLLGPFQVVPPD